MGAAGLLTELRKRGVKLVPVGDRLRFAPKDALTPDLVEALRAHKAEMLALLAGGQAADDPQVLTPADNVDAPAGEALAKNLDAPADEADSAELADAPACGTDPADIEPIEGIICPWCQRGDRLRAEADGWRCKRCYRLAWVLDGNGIARADYLAAGLIDWPDLVESHGS
ncbi:MAG: hypothetical protein KatS3mg111_0296 [Pirellulaceae bacterium]|nr:MAG: hypothetical protein KatS3mg111_0296 [Pirellulaceae bacterium]